MISSHSRPHIEHAFPHARAWFVFSSAPWLISLALLGIACLLFNSPWPALFGLPPFWFLVRLVLRQYAEQVSLCGYSLVICRGALSLRTAAVPVWHVAVNTRQSLLGRICNYGSVSIYADGLWARMDGIGDFRRLRALVMQRQSELA